MKRYLAPLGIVISAIVLLWDWYLETLEAGDNR